LAGRDIFDIHENAIRAHDRGQMIAQAAGVRGGILTAVADKNAARGWTYLDSSLGPERVARSTRVQIIRMT
jgi:hypothetical protein